MHLMMRQQTKFIMRTELFMCFCVKKDIGTQGEVCPQLKIFKLSPPPPHPRRPPLPPQPPAPEVNATDRSKAVVPVFSLFCVALWFIRIRGASYFKVFPCSLSSCFVIPFSIVIISLRKEGACLCVFRAVVCLLCTC